MASYSHRFCADIHAPAAALCVTDTGVLATACIHTKLQDVFADVFMQDYRLIYQANINHDMQESFRICNNSRLQLAGQ